MKKLITSLILAVSLLSVASSGGCKSGTGQYNPATKVYDVSKEGDPLVVNAQRTRGVALEVFDTFMKLERENEARLLGVTPTIHATAEVIRRDGKQWLTSLTEAISAYQSNRTDQAKFNLNQALAVVQVGLNSAQTALAKTKHP